MLAVIDYGLGNLRSICAALERLEIPHERTSDAARIRAADALIIPGVGAFQDGMRNLDERGLVPVLSSLVLEQRRPVLGICLGFQLMSREGFEFGRANGLGWLDAQVVRIEPAEGLRIPHVGWNDCRQQKSSPLFADVPADALFYFTHSYHVECHDSADVIATSDHGSSFVAAVQREHIFGTQFHPEKSQSHGLTVLKNFATRVAARC
jgi:imidazole glycerol-phosphate synthase subunit HisH